jgi:zinc transporter ZupT
VPAIAWIGVALIAVATVAGAAIGRRLPHTSAVPLAASAGILLAVVPADLAPDIWSDLAKAGLPWWTPLPVGVAGSAAVGWLTRRGCACQPGLTGSIGTTLAIGLHRALEGSTLAVTASFPLVLGLVAHAGSEGFAMASLLDAERQRRTAGWLLLACTAPALGALTLQATHLPDQATPILTSLVAGVLIRTALIAYRLAAARGTRDRSSGATATTTLTAIVVATTLTALHVGF